MSKREMIKKVKEFVFEGATPENIANQSTLCKLVAEKADIDPEIRPELWKDCMDKPRTPDEILQKYDTLLKRRRSQFNSP